MSKSKSWGQIEVMDDEAADILRTKSDIKRLEISWPMWSSARVLLTRYVRNKHPQWNDVQITQDVARRMSHGTI
jgi:hypothetical protein